VVRWLVTFWREVSAENISSNANRENHPAYFSEVGSVSPESSLREETLSLVACGSPPRILPGRFSESHATLGFPTGRQCWRSSPGVRKGGWTVLLMAEEYVCPWLVEESCKAICLRTMEPWQDQAVNRRQRRKLWWRDRYERARISKVYRCYRFPLSDRTGEETVTGKRLPQREERLCCLCDGR